MPRVVLGIAVTSAFVVLFTRLLWRCCTSTASETPPRVKEAAMTHRRNSTRCAIGEPSGCDHQLVPPRTASSRSPCSTTSARLWRGRDRVGVGTFGVG